MDNIKYHEYGKEYDYGEGHILTNNWDPDRDYGNEYVKVYFNIDTPTYKWNPHGVSWNSDQDRNAWKQEASALISSFGILEDCGYAVEHSSDKRAYLYAHPHQISGVIKKNDVKKVAEAIAGMKLSTMRWVDIRETVYVISDEEYEVYLCSRDEEIRNELHPDGICMFVLMKYSAYSPNVSVYQDLVLSLTPSTIQIRRVNTCKI